MLIAFLLAMGGASPITLESNTTKPSIMTLILWLQTLLRGKKNLTAQINHETLSRTGVWSFLLVEMPFRVAKQWQRSQLRRTWSSRQWHFLNLEVVHQFTSLPHLSWSDKNSFDFNLRHSNYAWFCSLRYIDSIATVLCSTKYITWSIQATGGGYN